jgi:hypothetical protein
VVAAIGLAVSGGAFAQSATGPPVFAGIFGADPLDIENPNNPGTDYVMLLHDANDIAVYDDLEYDPGRGYGFEVLDLGAFDHTRFGPFDDSPNRRGDFDDIIPDALYNSFIGMKNFSQTCDESVIGDMTSPCSTVIDPEGGIFRVDVPNGSYRFVGVFGDSDNVHAHRVLVEDGGSGPPTDIGENFVVLVGNHDQAQFEIGETEPAELGEGVYALVAFDDKRPPEAQGSIAPAFIPYDENGEALVDDDNFPTGAPPNSPVLNVSQGYLRLHLLQGNSNSGPGGERDPNGGDIVLFEVYPVAGDAPTALQPGDSNMDLEFNQLDLVQVQIAAKYLTGQPATWGEGDWNGGPGGSVGNPPVGDNQFNQLDIIAALNAGFYLQGAYGAQGEAMGPGSLAAVPEPSTVALVALGLLSLLPGVRRRAAR